MKVLEVSCPNCKKRFNYYVSDFRPFCTERCRDIDMGHWLSESYTVPVEKLNEDELETLNKLIDEKINQNQDDQEH